MQLGYRTTFNFFFNKYNNTKRELYVNYKLYWFRALSKQSTLKASNNYISYLYFFSLNGFLKKNFNFSNLYSNLNSLDMSIIRVNMRKKWIYNVRESRKNLRNYFFFIRNTTRLTKFLQVNKNVNWENIISSYTYSLFSLLLSQGLVYNFNSYKYFIINNIVLNNGGFVGKFYTFLNTNDIIHIYFTNHNSDLIYNYINYYKYIIESNNFYKKNCIFFSQNSLALKYCLERNYLNMSFLKIKTSSKLYVNTTISTFLNLTNLRLYNWLIIT